MRLPAYGRALAADRAAGRHPREIWVAWAEQWGPFVRMKRMEPEERLLCVRPAEFGRGLYDWRVCAGVPVLVMWADSPAPDWLLVELAAITAPVRLWWRQDLAEWPYEAGERYMVDAGEYLEGLRAEGAARTASGGPEATTLRESLDRYDALAHRWECAQVRQHLARGEAGGRVRAMVDGVGA